MQKDAELKEKKENLRIIYDMISDLWDYVDDLADYEFHEWIKPCILEKLQDMQQYAK